jgi:ATP-binding cassette subfamily B (MDR/TAP) protein 7
MKDASDAQPLNLLVQDIRFQNVNFVYSQSRPIFSDLTFTIPAGKRTAIVGLLGCGKCTILRLLFRFYDPPSGKISIGDQDIAQVQLANLWHHRRCSTGYAFVPPGCDA